MNLISKEHQSKLILLFLGTIVFSLFCWHYAKQITLWGDEAFSLLYYDNSSLLTVKNDVHLPTYYWIIKQILTIFNESSELTLRMLHIIPFIIGLSFGVLVVQRICKESLSIYFIVAIAISLPNFIFYATNLRMYSLLFMTEMIFIDAISRIINSKDSPSNYQLIWLVLSGFALVLTDYASIIYYFAGFFFVLIRTLISKEIKLCLSILIPILPLIYIAILSIENIQLIISWDIQTSSGLKGMSLPDLAKWLYLACRPVFDLIYPAGLPKTIAILFPLLILVLFLYSVVIFINKNSEHSQQHNFILLISMLWIPLALTGYGFTRLLLPSQFFIVTIIILAISRSINPIKFIILIMVGILLFLNLTEVISPTLRLYNLIPYSQIATDLVEFSKKEEITNILLSNNSLNTLSIHRYITKIDQTKNLKINRVNNKFLDNFPELKQQSFLFVSHLDENEKFVNIKEIIRTDNLQILKSYVSLKDLPYNPLWKQRILDRSSQSSAVQVYLIKP